jgi:Uma2 family endonuclease
MTATTRWTSADLELMPDDGRRYEIIDGELYMSKQRRWFHKYVCGKIVAKLDNWSEKTGLGDVNFAPGVIFAEDDDVAPDVVWISKARLATVLESDGKLHTAPELVIEVLSPGSANERRDREAKLKLYSQRGVSEHWIVDWRARQIEVYRRQQAQLHLIATLFETDTVDSPLLPGFACPAASLFGRIPANG